MPDCPRKKVAIVGGGSAGLAALWALNRTQHDVYVYEAADRLGGHAHTAEWRCGKYTARVDTGFAVMDAEMSPNFLAFLRKIGVPTERAPLALSVSRDGGAFEWSGASLRSLFCQRRNLLSPRMWRLLFDAVRFHQFARDLLQDDTHPADDEPLGAYLAREGYSDAFRDDYLVPLAAAVWSTQPGAALDVPAATMVRFLWNHRLLSLLAPQPEWRTIAAGARSYVDVVIKGFPCNHLFLGTPVLAVTTDDADGRVRLHLDGGRTDVYDHVVVATHGDEAYALVRDAATAHEAAILSQFRTAPVEAVLHGDTSQLPTRRAAWAGWNCLSKTTGPQPAPSSSSKSSSKSSSTLSTSLSTTRIARIPSLLRRRRHRTLDQVSLTFNMNVLQNIPRDVFGDVLVTLNPLVPPVPSTVQGRFRYTLPLCTARAVRAQRQLYRIQNTRGISYAGAWTRGGAHEDAFTSGLAVAVAHLGARLPFTLSESTTAPATTLTVADWLLRVVLWLVQVFVVETMEWLFGERRGMNVGVRREGLGTHNMTPVGKIIRRGSVKANDKARRQKVESG